MKNVKTKVAHKREEIEKKKIQNETRNGYGKRKF